MSIGSSIGGSLGRAIGSALAGGQSYASIVSNGVLAPYVTFTRADASSCATYFDSAGVMQIAAANEPRIDYNPSTLALRGLLIEEARTNLLWQSQCDLYCNANGTTPPTKTDSVTHLGVSCTSALFTAAMTSTGYSGCRLDRNTNSPESRAEITAGVQYTYSLYIALSRPLVGSESITYYWTGVSGSPTVVVINAANSADYVGAFVRCVITHTPASSGANFPVIYLSGAMSSDLTVYVTRGGCEAGAFATSYIPTTSAAVTRAVDVAVVSDLTRIGYNALEGTLYVEGYTAPGIGASSVNLVSLNDGTANELIALRHVTGGTTHDYTVVDGGVAQVDTAGTAVTALSAIKAAIAWKANDFAQSVNGGAAQTDASGTLPTVDRLTLGAFNGNIKTLRYYWRKFSPAELQALTA